MKETQGSASYQREQRRWNPRQYSFWTIAFGCLGIIFVGLWLFSFLFSEMGNRFALWQLLSSITQYSPLYPIAAVGFSFAAVVAELVSRFRIPPPTWRVRIELQRALIDLGLLDGEDTRKWRGVWWCAPLGKWSKKEKLFTLLFDCRTVKAKPEVFKELEQSIAGFHRSQDAAIETHKRKGNRACYRLMLWYTSNPYEKGLEDEVPW